MIKIVCNNKEYLSDSPVTVAQVFSHLLPENHEKPLGAFCGGRVLELSSILKNDCELIPITFSHEEGRRIYERSLRFILLLAVQRCYPEVRVRIEHSIGFGLYFEFTGKRVTQSDVLLIEDTMREIVREESNTANVTINVYGSEGQNIRDLANIVMDRITQNINRQEAAFA